MAPSSCSPLVTHPQSDNRADGGEGGGGVGRRRGGWGGNGRGEGEKWRIKERRRYGPERRKIRRTERERAAAVSDKKGSMRGEKREKEIERGKGVFSGWTAADLSWLDIRRTSRP